MKVLLRAVALATGLAVALAWAGVAAASGSSLQPINARGTTSVQGSSADATAGPSTIETPTAVGDGNFPGGGTVVTVSGPNRSNSARPRGPRGPGAPGSLATPTATSASVATASGLLSFEGVNHLDQRFGAPNQFSVEPPDQGLCAGNGHVVEVVNDIFRTYSTSGSSQTADESLNSFFHYPDAIIRATNTQGPSVTDPSCLYDTASGRFVVAVLTYEVIPSGRHRGFPTGANHIDLAVSQTGDPTGAWNLYSFAVQDDGTQGTPVHDNCPCLGDYPHIGMDANGFYVTTNEYPWFVDGFNGAQVYAISKASLFGGGIPVSVVHFDNLSAGGGPAFTMWPANSNPGDYSKDAGGTEYFLSSMATAEANNANGIDNRIAVWSLEHTNQLDNQTQNLALRSQVLGTETYGVPPLSSQKPGDTPLVDCANTPFCATALFGIPDPYTETISQLDSNDSRMQQVWYVNGTLVGALDTIVNVGGHDQAGIAYFSVNPHGIARLASQGYLAVTGNNVNYPAMATLPNGKGVMAFTLVGSDWYPSAAYAPVTVGSDGSLSVGSVSVAHAGAGPQDGFSGLKIESPTGDGVPRPRWGDYGAAAVDGSSIWIASEDIHQTCDFATYLATNFRCNATRTALGNWSTQITRVNP